MAQAYQRFVKTTPKPSATKNNKGELVGPPPPPPPPPELVGEDDGADEVTDEVEDMIATRWASYIYSDGRLDVDTSDDSRRSYLQIGR